jgi:hypothetical protein
MATHAGTLLPAALASVPFGFVLVRVRVGVPDRAIRNKKRAPDAEATATAECYIVLLS